MTFTLAVLLGAHAADISDAAKQFADRPLDAGARLAYAEAFLGQPGREEEGVAMLVGLTRTPEADAALARLAEIAAAHAARAGWADVYRLLATQGSAGGRSVGRARLAELRTGHADTGAPDLLDEASRGRIIDAALEEGRPELGAEALVGAARVARSPEARRTALEGAAGLLIAAASGTHERPASAPLALRALALRPGDPATQRDVAGILWADGRLEAALALYAAAAGTGDPVAERAAALIELALGRRAEAEARLARLPADDPEVASLREALARADAAAEARALEDPLEAEARWRALVARWPEDARFVHGLAGVVGAAGRLEEALSFHQEAVRLDPRDPWNLLGLAGALLALGREADARATLDGIPDPNDPEARRARDRLHATILRAEGEHLHASGDAAAAVRRYRDAAALNPDPWTTLALAGALLDAGETGEALRTYRTVQSTHMGDPIIDTIATRGEAGALEALGHDAVAIQALERLLERAPDPETHEALQALRLRRAVRDADALRRSGELTAAHTALSRLVPEAPEQPLVQAAWAALLLDLGRPEEAIDAAASALDREPGNPWALNTARLAGRAAGQSARVAPLFRAAVAGGAQEYAVELRRIEVSERLEAALAARSAGRPGAATAALREAARRADGDPAALLLFAEGASELGRPLQRRAALRRAAAIAPEEVSVVLACAQDLLARGRRAAAIALLDARWAADPDPRIGEALASARAGAPPSATARRARPLPPPDPEADEDEPTGDESPTAPALWEDWAELEEHLAHPAEVGPVPSGPVAPPDGAPERNDAPEEALTDADAPRFGPREIGPAAPPPPGGSSVLAVAGFGVLSRAGVDGIGRMLATYLPLHVGPPPLGSFRIDLELVLVRVTDGLVARWGAAPSIGIVTRLDRPWAAWLRAGTTPLGFPGPLAPTFALGGRGRVGAPLALGVEGGRAPVLDSLASWSGGTDFFTGDPFGRVLHTWGGGWAALGAPWGTDIGALGRIGVSEGIALDPVGRAEVVAWAGQRLGALSRNLRIGGEALGISHERQVDGFEVGQGGYYSPPLFGVATGRLDLRWSAFQDRLRVCGGAGAGVQYAAGPSTFWFQPGSAFTHNGRARVAWRAHSGFGITVEGAWLFAGDWHQSSVLARVGRGLDAAPPLHSFATPAAMLWFQGEPC